MPSDSFGHAYQLWRTYVFEGLAQPMHLLVIAFIALLVFGPSKLADLGKGLGQGIKSFKDAVNDAPEKPSVERTSKGSAA